MTVEYVFPRKLTLKILCKSKHFPRRHKIKRYRVFFSEHSVVLTIGVGAQSTLGGTTFLCENMYKKLTKFPNFT